VSVRSQPVNWRIRGIKHDLSRQGMVMGILNVTPDSFSDGGQFVDHDKAERHGLAMIADGAQIIDVGGESTRPGAQPVGLDDELSRVLPVIERLRGQSDVIISIDTMKAEVAKQAVAAGADIINDVSGLREQAMLEVAARSEAALIVMHMKGEPQTMQANPVYEDVVREVRDFFIAQMSRLQAAGIDPERIAFDPGFGFGKALEHNLALLRNLESLRIDGRPLVVGVSRKSMITKLINDPGMEQRFWPTVALTAWMRDAGAEIFRVHDVKANVEAMRMMEAIVHGKH